MASVNVAVPMPDIVTIAVPMSISQKPRTNSKTFAVFPENETVTEALVKGVEPSVPEAVSDTVYVIGTPVADKGPGRAISRMATATTAGNLKQRLHIQSSFSVQSGYSFLDLVARNAPNGGSGREAYGNLGGLYSHDFGLIGGHIEDVFGLQLDVGHLRLLNFVERHRDLLNPVSVPAHDGRR